MGVRWGSDKAVLGGVEILVLLVWVLVDRRDGMECSKKKERRKKVQEK